MFAGISWSQFLLYVSLAVLLYYAVVLLVYFRRELSQLLAKTYRATPIEKPRPPAETVPPVAVPVSGPSYNPIGASQDYGLGPVSPVPGPEPVGCPPQADLPAAAIILCPEATGFPDPADDDWFREEEDEAPDASVGEASYILPGEINMDTEFIGFERVEAPEVYEEGITVEGLVHTVELLAQESVPEGAKGEVIRQAGLMEDTTLWESFLANKDGVRDQLESLKQEVRQGRGGAPAALPDISHLPVPAQRSLFEDVDVDELINKVG